MCRREVIERQSSPCITRLASWVFARNIGFDGSEREWLVDQRREKEAAERPEKLRRLAERMRRDEEKRLGNITRLYSAGESGPDRRPLDYGTTTTTRAQPPRGGFENMFGDGGGDDSAHEAAAFRFSPIGETRQPQPPIPAPIPGTGPPIGRLGAAAGAHAPTYPGGEPGLVTMQPNGPTRDYNNNNNNNNLVSSYHVHPDRQGHVQV